MTILLKRGAALALAASLSLPVLAAENGWQAGVGAALGKSGAKMPGGVYRVGLPRTDLKATLDGVALKPGFALGGWLAFEKTSDQGMVMGDLVLTMDEVNPVMTKLAAARDRDHGLAQSPASQPAVHDVPARARARRSGAACREGSTPRLHKARRRSRLPLPPPQQHRRPPRRSTSIPPRSTGRSGPRAPTTAGSTNSASLAPSRSKTAA